MSAVSRIYIITLRPVSQRWTFSCRSLVIIFWIFQISSSPTQGLLSRIEVSFDFGFELLSEGLNDLRFVIAFDVTVPLPSLSRLAKLDLSVLYIGRRQWRTQENGAILAFVGIPFWRRNWLARPAVFHFWKTCSTASPHTTLLALVHNWNGLSHQYNRHQHPN